LETDSHGQLGAFIGKELVHSGLSPCQRRVLDLILHGLPEKKIAVRIHISQHTVHNHLRAIYRTLGVHSRSELLVRLLGNEKGASEK
jgi:DNA-binding CsgD family transcriptional regulator